VHGVRVEADSAVRAALAQDDLHRAHNNVIVLDELLIIVYPRLGYLPAELFFASQNTQTNRAKLITPLRSGRKTQRCYGRTLYRTCDLVERFLNRIAYFRRVPTRCDNGNVV
jgi:hypothetical protein